MNWGITVFMIVVTAYDEVAAPKFAAHEIDLLVGSAIGNALIYLAIWAFRRMSARREISAALRAAETKGYRITKP